MKTDALQRPSLMKAKDVRAFFKEINLNFRGYKVSITQGKKGSAHSWISNELTSKSRTEPQAEQAIGILIGNLLKIKFPNIAKYYSDGGLNDRWEPCLSVDFRTDSDMKT